MGEAARLQRCVGEFIGTFPLVFAGTGAIVADAATGGVVTHVGVSLTFGLVVMAMIYAVGDLSGAHLNPTVTCGFWIARQMPGQDVVACVISQVAGAVAASWFVRTVFPAHPTLGATIPSIPSGAATGCGSTSSPLSSA